MARVEAVPEREAGTFGRFAYGLPRLSEARLVELTAAIALENYRVRFTPSAWDRRVSRRTPAAPCPKRLR